MKMLFKCPGPHKADGIEFDYIVVKPCDIEQNLTDGWFNTLQEASTPNKEVLSREELEAGAASIGLKVDGRWSDAKLLQKIKEHQNG